MSAGALTALVAERLRDWEDQDEPALRAERTRELEALLAGPDKLEIIAALPAGMMDFAFGLPTFQQWMRAEPRAAADWMSSHPDISEARLLTLLQNWGAKNHDERDAYLVGLPQDAWQQKALAAASNLAMSSDPVAAIALAARMTADGRRTGLLELATVGWAKRDPAAATQWVNQVNDAALQQPLAGSLAVAYAEIDPVLAAQWAIRAVRPGAVLDRTLAEIAGAWAQYEPTAVAEWVARFPAGTGRQMAVGNLMNTWGNRDRVAATAWVRMLPDDGLRSQATTLLAALPDRSVEN